MHTTEPLDVSPLRAIARAFALALLVLFVLLLEYAARPARRRGASPDPVPPAAPRESAMPPSQPFRPHFSHHRPLALLILPLLFWISGCSPAPAAPTPPASAPPPAKVARPLVRDVPWTRMLPGHIEAIDRVALRARANGHVLSLHFDEGERVRKGQLLVRIDDAPHRAELREAEAALARARADADLAERELERAERLRERQLVAAADVDRRRAQAEIARAAVEAAAAAVASARLALDYTRVAAPIDGRIGRAEMGVGNLVGPDDTLATLVSDAVYVRFDIDEATVAQSDPSRWRARFSLPEAPGRSYEGRLAFLDNQVGEGTGSLRARVRLDGDPALLPGRYGQVELQLGQRAQALLVDETALGAEQGTRYLLTLDERNTITYRPVGVGERIGAWRVIRDGLGPDDRVVVSGLMRLRPGMTVTPEEVAMDSATTSTMAATAARSQP